MSEIKPYCQEFTRMLNNAVEAEIKAKIAERIEQAKKDVEKSINDSVARIALSISKRYEVYSAADRIVIHVFNEVSK